MESASLSPCRSDGGGAPGTLVWPVLGREARAVGGRRDAPSPASLGPVVVGGRRWSWLCAHVTAALFFRDGILPRSMEEAWWPWRGRTRADGAQSGSKINHDGGGGYLRWSGVLHVDLVRWAAWRRIRSDPIWLVQPAVVAISSVGGGRPEAGWSDLEIRHLVSAASWGDIVAGENRADGGRWRHSAPLP